jgi:putative oxidoreductase
MPPYKPTPSDAQLWLLLRLTLAGLLAAHGWTRLLGGGVVPFGEWLQTQGLPAGFYLAAAVTGYEIIATLLYAAGKWVWPLSLGFIAIYATGLWLVHAPFGWFVVGAGRNGMEYSVLLIICLALTGFRAYRQQQQPRF